MSIQTRFCAARRALLRSAAAFSLVAGIALPAHGGGPLDLVNQQPVVYPNGGTSLTLNLDQGPLGTRTNAQAAAIVQSAIAMWNGVATSTMRLRIGSPLAADYTAANYTNVYGRYADGLNPVMFDSDGSITDAIFGVGAKASILGFAGSAYYTTGALAGKYVEGQAVLNGSINISDATWMVVLAHEVGHFFGLDHSQLDGTQGLATSNYVLMYPIAYRSLQTLHEDDIAAVTALYPSANVGSTYGQLNGTFTTVGGTPILGANIWAKENATGKVYSIVSDFLTQGNGFFRLYLPAGTYTLNAESIASNFNGGSGVGPYSDTPTSASFQPPHPITPVALGGAAAQQVVITAGCLATATFRLDGTGSVAGNCTGLTPTPTTTSLTSSANPATVGSNVTLTATVAGTAPTGTVNFKDGGTTITGCGAAALSGLGNSRTALCSSSALAVGVHSIVAAYSGDAGNSASNSNTLSQVISGTVGSSNVALASAGAVASASSAFSGYPAAGANDGDRKGLNWGSGGGWNDATGSAFPDWLQIDFSGTKTIGEIDVFSVQDNYTAPSDPTPTMTFTQYGLTDFQAQYWTGSAWADVPGGVVTGNTLVWRKFSFPQISTTRIRVLVNAGLQGFSRIIEVEAWTPSGTPDTTPPSVPTNLLASAVTATGATISWTASTDNVGVIGYKVFRNGTQVAGSVVGTSFSDTGLAPSTSYIYTVSAFDAASNNSAQSSPLPVTTTAGSTVSMNVASQANGGVASASSAFGGYPASGANDGDRKGLNWGNGGGWNDATGSAFPDWLQIDFSGARTISEIDVFSVQDNYAAPSDPTPIMTFTQYGLTDFQVQYWTGSAWADILGGHVTGNNLVWRKFTFAPINTARIRVLVNAALQGFSRIIEVEAWTPVNVALQANGSVASASSAFSGYPASGTNDGDRKGLNWGSGGGWNDATGSAFPDWLQIDFSGARTISEIDVFSVQDNYAAPSDPTPTMTFTQYGLTDFQVQYWTGSAWADIPGGHATGNNLVWRKFTFAPISTTRIRVLVNAALQGFSRIVEVEAWSQ